MESERRDLIARRNAPFTDEWTYTAEDSDEPYDFSGATAALQVRQYGAQGGSALIDLPETSLELTEGVLVGEGVLTVFIDEATLQLLPQGKPGEPVIFTYDLKVTPFGSVEEVWSWGTFTVKPGVTDRLIILSTGAAVLTTDDGAILTG